MQKMIFFSFFLTILLLGNLSSVAAANTATLNGELEYISTTATEAKVRKYFADTPEMIEIARCESKFRQYTDNGSVLRGGSGGGMVGVFQFFESVHTNAATRLGHDITTLAGNLAYAEHVYKTQGTTPWNSAKNCWNVTSLTESTTEQADLQRQITLLLQIIELLKQIQALQSL